MFNTMNNPMMQLVQMMRNGQNPMQMMEQWAQKDPRMGQAMSMIRGKSPQQLEQMARNMAKERGIDLDMMRRQLGI